MNFRDITLNGVEPNVEAFLKLSTRELGNLGFIIEGYKPDFDDGFWFEPNIRSEIARVYSSCAGLLITTEPHIILEYAIELIAAPYQNGETRSVISGATFADGRFFLTQLARYKIPEPGSDPTYDKLVNIYNQLDRIVSQSKNPPINSATVSQIIEGSIAALHQE